MGAGTAGDFGNTKGSRDNIKAALKTLGTIIDVADTVNDLRSLPEDIKEKDWVSVGLDTLGIMPLVGKIVDSAKIADHTVNAIKATKKAKKAKKITSVCDNAESVAKKYNLDKFGNFGKKGDNCRVFKCDDPVKESAEFYKKISKGGAERPLPNGKGVQTYFDDHSNVVYRVVTKTPDSPAVNINIETPGKIRKQKIHFIK